MVNIGHYAALKFAVAIKKDIRSTLASDQDGKLSFERLKRET